VSASAEPFRNRTTVRGPDGNPTRVNCPTPRALSVAEIAETVEDYRRAAVNARSAGFDFAELHGAHGYLLHQFTSTMSNRRDDQYGGSVENRARIVLEAVDVVIDAWEPARVGVRFSPFGSFNGLDESPEGEEMALYLAAAFASRGLGFIHLSEPDWAGGPTVDDAFRRRLREAYDGVIIGAGNYDAAKAERLLEAELIDAAAFGRDFIANPDLPERLRVGAELNPPNPATFYGGGEAGYTDYPTLNN
jgi:N-ethylmaleimide reductase